MNQPSLISPKQCPSFEGCSAPICPLDRSFGLGACWYPTEAVCQALPYRRAHWRKSQVKIDRIAKDRTTCYTAKMLAAVRQVRAGITGIEDSEDAEAETAWLRQRPGRPSLNDKAPELDIKENLDGPEPLSGQAEDFDTERQLSLLEATA